MIFDVTFDTFISGLVADIDIESEKYRWMGSARIDFYVSHVIITLVYVVFSLVSVFLDELLLHQLSSYTLVEGKKHKSKCR